MNYDSDLECHDHMGLSWRESPFPPEQNAVSLTVQELAGRLDEIARELHMAYQNPPTGTDNIVLALYLLDILQAELD
jgi:hypothetical protein